MQLNNFYFHVYITVSLIITVLQIFDVISSGNLSCGKIPLPDVVDTCRDVLDIVLDCLESRETSNRLTQLEQLRFVLSQPHFQVRKTFVVTSSSLLSQKIYQSIAFKTILLILFLCIPSHCILFVSINGSRTKKWNRA